MATTNKNKKMKEKSGRKRPEELELEVEKTEKKKMSTWKKARSAWKKASTLEKAGWLLLFVGTPVALFTFSIGSTLLPLALPTFFVFLGAISPVLPFILLPFAAMAAVFILFKAVEMISNAIPKIGSAIQRAFSRLVTAVENAWKSIGEFVKNNSTKINVALYAIVGMGLVASFLFGAPVWFALIFAIPLALKIFLEPVFTIRRTLDETEPFQRKYAEQDEQNVDPEQDPANRAEAKNGEELEEEDEDENDDTEEQAATSTHKKVETKNESLQQQLDQKGSNLSITKASTATVERTPTKQTQQGKTVPSTTSTPSEPIKDLKEWKKDRKYSAKQDAKNAAIAGADFLAASAVACTKVVGVAAAAAMGATAGALYYGAKEGYNAGKAAGKELTNSSDGLAAIACIGLASVAGGVYGVAKGVVSGAVNVGKAAYDQLDKLPSSTGLQPGQVWTLKTQEEKLADKATAAAPAQQSAGPVKQQNWASRAADGASRALFGKKKPASEPDEFAHGWVKSGANQQQKGIELQRLKPPEGGNQKAAHS